MKRSFARRPGAGTADFHGDGWTGPAMPRRVALSLLSAGVLASTTGWSGRSWAADPGAGGAAPLLGTPEQIEAEDTLLRLLGDPELKRIQAQLRAELAATPRGRTADGAVRLDNAIAEWTNSLIFAEIASYRPHPAILWATDDTPRTWHGHTLGGVGTSGDNPDAIYRVGSIDGAGRYEILGRFDKAHRAAQLIFEADRGDLAKPAQMMAQNSKHSEITSTLAQFTDRDLVVGPDGGFRITLGGPAGGPNHIATPPGPVTAGFRDMLSDWRQRPCRLSIRRLDTSEPQPFDPAELRRRIYADLPGYVRFWARFPDIWFVGLKSNTVSDVTERKGGLGFMAGLRFGLAPGQAILVTTTSGNARYTGFQLVDPWMIAPNGKRNQVSLNLSQARPNADGSFTYVVAREDPGVANWLDTAGLHDGIGIIRWQAVPPGVTKTGLLREFRVIQVADLANMPHLPRVTPQERRAQLAARARAYASRAH